MTDNDKRIRRIFKECFEFIDKYKTGVRKDQWKELSDYCSAQSGTDEFAGMMYAACYQELARISKELGI